MGCVTSTNRRLAYLCATPLFTAISQQQIQSLADCFSLEKFEDNEIIYRQGESSNKLYVLGEGLIDIYIDPSARSPSYAHHHTLSTKDLNLHQGQSQGHTNTSFPPVIKEKGEFDDMMDAGDDMNNNSADNKSPSKNQNKKPLTSVERQTQMEILKHNLSFLCTRTVGSSFGHEMLSNSPRSATVIAKSGAALPTYDPNNNHNSSASVELISIKRSQLKQFFKKFPKIESVVLQSLGLQVQDCLRCIPFFKSIPSASLFQLSTMLRWVPLSASQVLFDEGTLDEEGNSMYIVYSGCVKATSMKDDRPLLLNTITQNQFFGEIGLMVDMPRTASISATTRSLLLELRKADFANFLKVANTPKLTEKLVRVCLRRMAEHLRKYNIPFFAAVPFDMYKKLARRCTVRQYQPGQIICLEGETKPTFYIIAHGRVELTIKRPTQRQRRSLSIAHVQTMNDSAEKQSNSPFKRRGSHSYAHAHADAIAAAVRESLKDEKLPNSPSIQPRNIDSNQILVHGPVDNMNNMNSPLLSQHITSMTTEGNNAPSLVTTTLQDSIEQIEKPVTVLTTMTRSADTPSHTDDHTTTRNHFSDFNLHHPANDELKLKEPDLNVKVESLTVSADASELPSPAAFPTASPSQAETQQLSDSAHSSSKTTTNTTELNPIQTAQNLQLYSVTVPSTPQPSPDSDEPLPQPTAQPNESKPLELELTNIKINMNQQTLNQVNTDIGANYDNTKGSGFLPKEDDIVPSSIAPFADDNFDMNNMKPFQLEADNHAQDTENEKMSKRKDNTKPSARLDADLNHDPYDSSDQESNSDNEENGDFPLGHLSGLQDDETVGSFNFLLATLRGSVDAYNRKDSTAHNPGQMTNNDSITAFMGNSLGVNSGSRRNSSSSLPTQYHIGELGPGSYMGESSIMTDTPIAASVTALTRCVMISLSKKSLEKFWKVCPEAAADFHIKCQRYTVSLDHILVHPIGLKFFTEHLKHEFSEENVLFLNAARQWKKSFAQLSTENVFAFSNSVLEKNLNTLLNKRIHSDDSEINFSLVTDDSSVNLQLNQDNSNPNPNPNPNPTLSNPVSNDEEKKIAPSNFPLKDLLRDASALIKTFVQIGSSMQINIQDTTRQNVEKQVKVLMSTVSTNPQHSGKILFESTRMGLNLESENDILQACLKQQNMFSQIFDDAMQEVTRLMAGDSFIRFKQSQLFADFLNETKERTFQLTVPSTPSKMKSKRGGGIPGISVKNNNPGQVPSSPNPLSPNNRLRRKSFAESQITHLEIDNGPPIEDPYLEAHDSDAENNTGNQKTFKDTTGAIALPSPLPTRGPSPLDNNVSVVKGGGMSNDTSGTYYNSPAAVSPRGPGTVAESVHKHSITMNQQRLITSPKSLSSRFNNYQTHSNISTLSNNNNDPQAAKVSESRRMSTHIIHI